MSVLGSELRCDSLRTKLHFSARFQLIETNVELYEPNFFTISSWSEPFFSLGWMNTWNFCGYQSISTFYFNLFLLISTYQLTQHTLSVETWRAAPTCARPRPRRRSTACGSLTCCTLLTTTPHQNTWTCPPRPLPFCLRLKPYFKSLAEQTRQVRPLQRLVSPPSVNVYQRQIFALPFMQDWMISRGGREVEEEGWDGCRAESTVFFSFFFATTGALTRRRTLGG